MPWISVSAAKSLCGDDTMITDPDTLLASVAAVHEPGARRFVGVVGPPGSGKTHVARFLHQGLTELVTGVVPMDGFHLANDTLESFGLRHYKGRPDTFDVAGFVDLLDRLHRRETGAVYAPRFVREIEEPIAGSLAIAAEVELIIVEGNYLLVDEPPWDAVADRLDATYYLDTPESVRMQRLLVRQERTHGPQGAVDWIERVDRPNSTTVEATRWRADQIVSHFDLPGEPVH